MIDLGKYNIIGVQINAIDYETAVDTIITAANHSQTLTVSALAVHGVMTGVLDKFHRYRLNHFDLIVPDGQPVRWALNLLYNTKLNERVYGPYLTLKICQQAAEKNAPIYLYGSRIEVLETLVQKLQAKFPNLKIAGYQPSKFRNISFQEKKEIVEEIIASGAKIVFVGLGCPRQEVWAYEYSNDLPMPIIAVGAAFDFHAGTLSQAPPFLQSRGLEWLYRLVQEPNRLWKRYILLNPLYVFLLALQLLKLKTFDLQNTTQPKDEVRYG